MKKLIFAVIAIAVMISAVCAVSFAEEDPAAVPSLEGRDNLALECEVTATNSFENNQYFSTVYLTDGVHVPLEVDQHAGWSIDPFSNIPRDEPVDIEVDLLMVYLLDTVVIKPCLYNNGEKMPSSFTIDISEDGSNYTTVKEVTGLALTAADDQIYTFEPVRGRYVRIAITEHSDKIDNTGSYLSEFSELEVYGEAIKPTEAPATPEPTPTPEPDPTEPPAAEPTAEPGKPQKKGCGSVMTGCVSLVLIAAVATVIFRKKK